MNILGITVLFLTRCTFVFNCYLLIAMFTQTELLKLFTSRIFSIEDY